MNTTIHLAGSAYVPQYTNAFEYDGWNLMAKVNPFRFSTKYQDDESDLLYYGYRLYNSSQGRWGDPHPGESKNKFGEK